MFALSARSQGRSSRPAQGGKRAYEGRLGKDRVGAKAAVPLEARNSLHRLKQGIYQNAGRTT